MMQDGFDIGSPLWTATVIGSTLDSKPQAQKPVETPAQQHEYVSAETRAWIQQQQAEDDVASMHEAFNVLSEIGIFLLFAFIAMAAYLIFRRLWRKGE